MRDRVTVWLGVVGVLAVVAGVVLAIVTLWPDDEPTKPTAQHHPATPYVSRAGGFSVQVPKALTATGNGPTARFTSADRTLVVSVGPSSRAPLRAASGLLVQRIRATYAQVRVLGHRTDRVDRRRALTTYGRARNGHQAALRFVVTVVAARPRTYALTVFTAAGSDPARVVPVVNRLVGSFHVLSAKERRHQH
jgi:hypothetical protein